MKIFDMLHKTIIARKEQVKMLLLFVFVCLSFSLFSQNKTAEKANEVFKQNNFAEAATLYEQALREMEAEGKGPKSAVAIKTKLAYCYRMNNRLDKAESLYAELVQEDKAKAETYFYYGEALMANGKYEEAKKWFQDYQKLQPDDENGRLMAEACEKAPFIKPYFQYLYVQEFAHNSTADDNGPVFFDNGIVFSSDRKTGLKFMKEKSGWTGRDYLDIYFSEKKQDGTFGEPKQYSSKLSEVNKNTGNASFSKDGTEVFFTRNDNATNKQETYSLQLFRAETTGGGWKSVEKLPFCYPAFNFMHPAISPDGKTLYFTSNKSGGQGGTDLWMAERTDKEWGRPVNLGAAINTSANEGFPFVDADGRLYFCSKGHPGFGGFDIFMTEKKSNGDWKKPLNLGKPINSPLDDISIFIAPDRKSGMFTSSRNGGDDDIYLFSVLDHAPVQPEIVAASEKIAPEINEPKEVLVSAEQESPVVEAVKMETGEEKTVPILEQPIEEQVPVMEEVALEEKAPVMEEAILEENAPIVEEIIYEEKAPVVEEAVSEKVTPIEEVPVVEEKENPTLEEVPVVEEKENPTLEEEVEAIEEKVILEEKPILPAIESSENIEIPSTPKPEILENTASSTTPNISENQAENHSVSTAAPVDPEVELIEKQPIVPIETIPVSENEIAMFNDFAKKSYQGTLKMGERYRLDGAVFDANIWQLTPPVATMLDKLAEVLRRNPNIQVEISAFTEALGVDEENLRLSQNRADMAKEYLVKEGIAANRLIATGYGETMPLNKCRNGVICSLDEHLFNQRLEISVLKY